MELIILKLLRLSLVPLALLCVLVLRLSRGRIRIGVLQTNRIGHLAGNVEVYLCERDAGIRPRILELWIAPGEVCNAQLLKMWRRVIRIDRTGFVEIMWKVNRLFKGWQRCEIPTNNLDRDVNNLYEKYPPHLRFTEAEELRGLSGLIELGVPPGSKWVCLLVRDGTYLPHLDYHRHRDSNIKSYRFAAEALAERGYYVIRMGAKVEKPMVAKYIVRGASIAHQNGAHIIDYATNGMRSDFMDIYLTAKCAFALNNGTGLDAVCCAFRRPSCYVNFVPVEYLSTWNRGSLAIWKHHYKDGKRMTPAEIWASGSGQFMRAEEYEAAGITLVDNTPEEITDVVLEMTQWVEAPASMHYINWRYDDKQDAFWKDFPRSISPFTRTPLHGEIRMRIGREFLRGYGWVARDSIYDMDEADAKILQEFFPSTKSTIRKGYS